MFKYSILLSYSEEDGGYISTIAEFPDLSAFGESPEDAAREARIAAEGMIKVLKEDGDPVPEPRPIRMVA